MISSVYGPNLDDFLTQTSISGSVLFVLVLAYLFLHLYCHSFVCSLVSRWVASTRSQYPNIADALIQYKCYYIRVARV